MGENKNGSPFLHTLNELSEHLSLRRLKPKKEKCDLLELELRILFAV